MGLLAAPEIVTEAPSVEKTLAEGTPVVITSAAQTADIAGISILAVVIVLFGIAFISRKK